MNLHSYTDDVRKVPTSTRTVNPRLAGANYRANGHRVTATGELGRWAGIPVFAHQTLDGQRVWLTNGELTREWTLYFPVADEPAAAATAQAPAAPAATEPAATEPAATTATTATATAIELPLPALELWRFASQDECRPALNCVRIEAGDGHLEAVAIATDGHRLTTYTWTCTEGERALLAAAPLAVYVVAAKNIAAAARKGSKARKARKSAVESVKLIRDADGRSIVARLGAQAWTLQDHTNDGAQFPEWRRVLPTAGQGPNGIKRGLQQVTFNPVYFGDIGAYLKAAGVEWCALDIGSIGDGLDPLLFTVEIGLGHADFIVMPMRK